MTLNWNNHFLGINLVCIYYEGNYSKLIYYFWLVIWANLMTQIFLYFCYCIINLQNVMRLSIILYHLVSSDFDKLFDFIDDSFFDGKILIGVNTLIVQDKFLNIDGTFKVITNTGGSGSSFNNAFTADLNANSHKITNLSDPTNYNDASTKAYIDNKYLSLVDATILTPSTIPIRI